ncbi:MAG: serine/threonine protein kinase [Verrucomicrobia bacterium]|nr:serine/threonine protein kinase [Verrucomicrobiota bacterium]
MAADGTIGILSDRVDKIACHKCHASVDVRSVEPFDIVVCSACGAELPVPALLGQFVLLKELGKGAMGAVYKAFDRTLKRNVAIKVMLQSLGRDQQFTENFLREARSLAALNNPNVVQIYSCGQEKGQPYMVMELLDGGRLDDYTERAEQMDEVKLLEIGLEVVKGLKAASTINMVHGDVKPANVLFDKNGTAKVVDFGLARIAQKKQGLGEIWGTPYYIAPEKARKEKEDQRADIYSLGATLFHALAGHPPFEGKTAQDVVIARLRNPAPSLREYRSDLHERTVALIARMLDAEPFKRYPNYDSLLTDFERALQGAKTEPIPVIQDKPRSKGKQIVIGLVLLALAGLVIALTLSRSGREEPKKETGKEGPVRMKLINGKLVPVRVPVDEGN